MSVSETMKERGIVIMIDRKNNRIYFTGGIQPHDLKSILYFIFQLTEVKGYKDIVLDFRTCTAAFHNVLVPLCMQLCKQRLSGIETTLILPEKEKLRRLFVNSNWAFLIDPTNQPKTRFLGIRQLPATTFLNSDEQFDAVNSAIEVVLESTLGISRDALAALEWALTEITVSVISHSKSKKGHEREQKCIPHYRVHHADAATVVQSPGLTYPGGEASLGP